MTLRTLVLLRHAKAEPPTGIEDVRRPLSARGQVHAQAAGAWLAGRYVPEVVVCSPSKRTRQTWHAVLTSLTASGASESVPVHYDPRLYGADMSDLLAVVWEGDDAIGTMLLIGHNPVLSQLAYGLDPHGGLDSDGLSTCGISVHQVAGRWLDCQLGKAPVTARHTARGE